MDSQTRRPAIVLVEPEIPGNTGSIGRTCVALEIDLILIKPYGFNIDDRAVRRAGLDYWKHVALREYDSWEAFLAAETPAPEEMYFFEEFGETNVYDAAFTFAPFLIFGKETKGLPEKILTSYRHRTFRLPMRSDHIRSLNLANAATAVVFLALQGGWLSK